MIVLVASVVPWIRRSTPARSTPRSRSASRTAREGSSGGRTPVLPAVALERRVRLVRRQPVDLDGRLARDQLVAQVADDVLAGALARVAPPSAARHADDDPLAPADDEAGELRRREHAG